MKKLKLMVPIQDLTPGNIGGPVWAHVKAHPEEGLKWDKLVKAKLWTDVAQYKKSVHDWLCTGAQDFQVEVQKALTGQGEVQVVDIEVGEERTAKMHVGPTGQLLQKRNIVDVIHIEVQEDATELPPMVVPA